MLHFLGTPARLHVWKLTDPNSNEAKTLRKRLLSGPSVDIYIGRERKHWSLPRNLLCHYSPYFQTELLGHEVPKPKSARNGTATTIELPDEDPRGFALLVKWLYHGRLDSTTHLTDEQKYEYAVACHKLHRLSTRFSLPDLSNLAIDAYRANLHAAHLVPDAEEINDIYRSEPPGSPFRELMVRIAARQIMDPEVGRDARGYACCFEGDAGFAVEVVNAIRVMSGGLLLEDPTGGDDCLWHVHEGEGLCEGKGGDGSGGISKVQSSHSRRTSAPSRPMNISQTQPKPGQSKELSNQLVENAATPSPTRSIAPQTHTPPNSIPTSTPRPNTTKPKPRKLERTPAKPTPTTTATIAATATATANEARKLTPKPTVRVLTHNPNNVQIKSNHTADRVAAKTSAKSPVPSDLSTTTTTTMAAPTRARSRENHVDGIVRRFNRLNVDVNANGAGSEAGTSGSGSVGGSVGRRRPVKLRVREGSVKV